MARGFLGSALALWALALSAPSPARSQVRWHSGSTSVPAATRDQIHSSIQALATNETDRHVLVKLDGPAPRALAAQLAADGLVLLDYVGDDAYFATLRATPQNAERLANSQSVKNVVAISSSWKLHPDLTADRVPPWAIVGRNGPTAKVGAIEKTEAGAGLTIAAYVKLHPDVRLEVEGVEACRRHGAKIRSYLSTINGLVVEMPLANVAVLAEEDIVEWIEPPLPRLGPTNNGIRARVGANTAQAPPYGLTGAGVTALVYDSGTARASHVDFGGRLSIRDGAPLYEHSTHVAGTLGGSGAASGGLHRGMAPGVQIESYGFEQSGGPAPGFLYTDPGDLEADYGDAINSHGANLANNSIGTNVAVNGFPCEWEGNYGLTSSVIDAIARGSLGTPLPIVWAAGNERKFPSRCGALYGTIAPPSGSKNALCVGAVNSNDDSMTSFSGWGPTDDGRLKPDICAPGCEVGGDNGVTSTSGSSDVAYSVFCGTSMAAPTVTGLGALLLEDYRAQYPERPDFRSATLKAVLAHTAIDLGNTGPDYQFGYGSVRVVPAIEQLRSGYFVEGSLELGSVYQASVTVIDGEAPLRVTLAWDDAPAAPNVVTTLVNDLELRVYDPTDGVHFPWTLDAANPAAPAIRIQADHLNNMEQVVIDGPAPGVYRIEVTGFTLPMGPQTFSLCASPRLAPCSSRGSLAIGRSTYSCFDSLTVQVVDCDLNANDQTVETTTAHVASGTNPIGSMVQLTESAADSATFTGTVQLTETLSPRMERGTEFLIPEVVEGDPELVEVWRLLSGEPGAELLVTHGDSVAASYVDADDGEGGSNVMVSDSANVDCQGPATNNLQVASLGPRRATITFDTDEPVYASLLYGTDCEALSSVASSGGIRTQHTINLKDLVETTTYYYVVWIMDEAGNFSVVPSDESCLSFTTPVVPEFFTEIFESDDNDLEMRSILFTPDGSADFYTACVEPITILPTNPTGGTVLAMPDDGPPVTINVGGGASVWLYGQAYTTFHVSPNGYIVFGTPDTWFLETTEKHFLFPRISAFFDDLDPTMGGSVSWIQLADRVAVTWLNVPEWFGFNSNTFQAELYFDGRIQITLLNLDAFDGLVGLSAGSGLSPDYYESDLSAIIPCNEEAPMALEETAETPMNASAAVMLTATDENDSTLTYIVTSLPTHGRLSDPLSGPIESVPYELAAGGREVHYAGYSGFAGGDAFSFQAADAYFVSNEAAVRVLVGTRQPAYQFPLNSNPGWTVQGAWGFGPPLGLSGDPATAWTGSNVFGFNLAGAYSNNIGSPQFLTTSVMDCSTLAGTRVRFRRWLGIQASSGDQAKVEVATSQNPWTPEWQHVGTAIGDTSWTLVDLDISGLADGKTGVRVRWGLGPTDASGTSCGWNLDDIEIWGIPPGPCNEVIPGDADLNGVVDGRDVAAFVEVLLNPPGPGVHEQCASDLVVDGIVNLQDVEFLAGELLK
ncbi:MAG TPA: S8 family serine peptidase [Phycisphaerae bacterium]|nr:S8 family serine peptidase [Phycisphaerae bacterium]